jgi:hypothetical protein
MKKITLMLFVLMYTLGFSQNAPITFETAEFGSSWSFASFENAGGVGYEKVANPFKTGINTSEIVSKFTALTTAAGAAPWAGCESAHSSGVNGIGSFTFSLSNCIVRIMVYKPIISDVGIKFAEANGEAQPEVKVKNTKINEWEELTFDMSGSIGKGATGIIDQIIFFPDFQARTTENVCYFDNVTFSAKSGTTATASTTVTIDGSSALTGYLNWFNKDGSYANGSGWAIADVKTVSDATNDKVTLSPNFSAYNATDTYWSDGAGKGNKIIEGNSFIENSALAGQVLTFNGAVSSNTLADGYTAIAFIKGLDASKGYEDVLKITAPLVAGQSFSMSTGTAIPAGLIVQYGFTIKGLNGNPVDEAALGKVVIGKAALSTTKFEASNIKMYPNPVKNSLTIDANSTINKVSVYNILGQEVLTINPKSNSATLQTNNLQKGLYIVKTEIDGKLLASKIIKE